MKRLVVVWLAILFCLTLPGCTLLRRVTSEADVVYEEKFLGTWSDGEIMFSFKYKDGKYCGGVMYETSSGGLGGGKIVEYRANKKTIELVCENLITGNIQTVRYEYKFEGDFLYLEGSKFTKTS